MKRGNEASSIVKRPKKSNTKKIIIAILTIVILAALIYLAYTTFYFKTCYDKACFETQLAACSKATFTSVGNMTFNYKILGVENSTCKVNAKLITGNLNEQDSQKLIGRDMNCFLPLGLVSTPESNIDTCHGTLKEALQDIIIQKLHTYIAQNLGKIAAQV